jgi:putative oxidoreductase
MAARLPVSLFHRERLAVYTFASESGPWFQIKTEDGDAIEGETVLRKIVNTNNDFTLTILRLILGVIFLCHGGQKVLGWFGGSTFGDTMHAFTQNMHIPAPLAFLAIMAEFAGGIGLIVGFLGRIAAFGIICNMVVAISMVHGKFGLFMNWSQKVADFSTAAGEGYEYHLLAIAVGLAILVKGSGALSIDRALTRKA